MRAKLAVLTVFSLRSFTVRITIKTCTLQRRKYLSISWQFKIFAYSSVDLHTRDWVSIHRLLLSNVFSLAWLLLGFLSPAQKSLMKCLCVISNQVKTRLSQIRQSRICICLPMKGSSVYELLRMDWKRLCF